MAAIDKIYLNYPDTKEFLDWADRHDAEFLKEFKESTCYTLLNFFYLNRGDLDETFKDKGNAEELHCICKIPEMVEKWIMRHDNVPKGTLRAIRSNYRFNEKTPEEVRTWIDAPLETEDKRTMGKHVKILSRSGCFEHGNKGRIQFENYNRRYYREQYCKRHNINYLDYPQNHDDVDKYTNELMGDIYWYCYDTDSIENCWYPKKKNIWSGRSSSLERPGTKSVKAAIRQIIKANVFPIGTIICIGDFRYVGEIVLKVTK